MGPAKHCDCLLIFVLKVITFMHRATMRLVTSFCLSGPEPALGEIRPSLWRNANLMLFLQPQVYSTPLFPTPRQGVTLIARLIKGKPPLIEARLGALVPAVLVTNIERIQAPLILENWA
jgi:hypothetical protein